MRLFTRCDHQWQEVHRDVQPRKAVVRVTGDPRGFDDVLYGCTHVELCCSRCGDVTTRKLSGEHPTPRGL